MDPRALLTMGYKASKKKVTTGLRELWIVLPIVVKRQVNHKMKKTYQAVHLMKITILETTYQYQPHREISSKPFSVYQLKTAC